MPTPDRQHRDLLARPAFPSAAGSVACAIAFAALVPLAPGAAWTALGLCLALGLVAAARALQDPRTTRATRVLVVGHVVAGACWALSLPAAIVWLPAGPLVWVLGALTLVAFGAAGRMRRWPSPGGAAPRVATGLALQLPLFAILLATIWGGLRLTGGGHPLGERLFAQFERLTGAPAPASAPPPAPTPPAR